MDSEYALKVEPIGFADSLDGGGAECVRVREKSGRTLKIFGLIKEKERVSIYYDEEYWQKSRVVWEAGNQHFSFSKVKFEVHIRYPSGNIS